MKREQISLVLLMVLALSLSLAFNSWARPSCPSWILSSGSHNAP